MVKVTVAGTGQVRDEGTGIERPTSLAPLVARLRSLGTGGGRVLVGLAGAPGVGKSTLAAALAAAMAPEPAMVIPMDGFHLAAEVLAGTPLAGRRGAIDTFDAHGFVHLLTRLRRQDEDVVLAPRYSREIEDPIAAAIAVPAGVDHLVVEGSYLLADAPVWRSARAQLDEVWFLDLDPQVRVSRLVGRHVEFGKSHEQALSWTHGSDGVNARLVDGGRASADLVIDVGDLRL